MPDKRTIVLCFDGTSNVFGEEKNTNVIHLMSMLQLEGSEDGTQNQRVYYQTGIGTYDPTGRGSWPIVQQAKLILDQAFALCLKDHVLGGYKFLMEAYRPGDEICMFGYSRGAYTARALAGMLHVVGLVPSNNMELVPFAYDIFSKSKEQDEKSPDDELCDRFKKTFSRDVKIRFIGLWDTVSSVGLFPRTLPNTGNNESVQVVRHALSLDENRVKFKAEPWNPPPESQKWVSPTNPEAELEAYLSGSFQRGTTGGSKTDIKEVWFSGYHGDVGGGCAPAIRKDKDGPHPPALSNIPLQWLIREAMENTNILFKKPVLEEFGIMDEKDAQDDRKYHEREKNDALNGKTHGALETLFSWWWILEFIPLLLQVLDNGVWTSKRV
ncbi:hypothetical protein FRB99_004369 [Tulasnella sp. 403]|nr:hypothetical protein FRB99_004369 [Tulasnella sp. 403]